MRGAVFLVLSATPNMTDRPSDLTRSGLDPRVPFFLLALGHADAVELAPISAPARKGNHAACAGARSGRR